MVIRVIHDIPHCNGSIILATQAGDEYILLYDAPVQSKHFDGFGIWNEGNKKGNPNFEVFSRITIFKLFFYHVNFLSHFLKKTNNLKISVGDKETLFFLHFFKKIPQLFLLEHKKIKLGVLRISRFRKYGVFFLCNAQSQCQDKRENLLYFSL